ncbi:hypothetical protein FBU30_003364 [Linnemannia zychae]|nr:hypothetical protein FBU30_003364 [Linnemannia zychae]
MTFIHMHFGADNSTLSEKENSAALKTLVKDHRAALKVEYKQFYTDYKQALKDAENEYRQAKKQAEETMHLRTIEAVKREIEIIMTTDEYANADEKTKAKMAQFQSWMSHSAITHRSFADGDEEVEGASDHSGGEEMTAPMFV